MNSIEKLKLSNRHEEATNHIVDSIINNKEPNYKGGAFLVKNDYLNYVKHFIQANANKKIKRIEIFRQPINKAIEVAMKMMSLGKFTPQKYGYDAFYHLGLIATLEDNRRIIIEKNANINIMKISKLPRGEYFNVHMNNTIPLKQFLDNAMNPDYFYYDAFENNCQVFVMNLLKSNNLLTDNSKEFIYQDISSFINKKGVSNMILKGVSKFTTNLGGIANRVIYGGSLTDKYNKINI